MTRLHKLSAAAMIGQIIPDEHITRTKPSDCGCGNPEGTNKECERHQCVQCGSMCACNDGSTDAAMCVCCDYVSAEEPKREITWCNICFDFVCTCQATQQKRNDAMERGDYERDRAKDEKIR